MAMSRVIVLSNTAAFVAFLFFAIPAQADEIEPEPEPAPIAEPEPEPEPEPAKDDGYARDGIYLSANVSGAWYTEVKDDTRGIIESAPPVIQTILDKCISPTNPDPCDSGVLDSNNPVGLGVRVGYRFHPHLAAEIELQWYSDMKIDFLVNDDTTKLLKLESLTLTGNVKGYLLTGRIQPFVVAGAGLMHFNAEDRLNLGIVKSKGDAFAGRFGVGIDFYINKNIVVVTEGGYVLPTGDADGLDYVFWSVGLQYRF